MTKLKSLEFEGITIPVTTPCRASGNPPFPKGVAESRGICPPLEGVDHAKGVRRGRFVSTDCQIIARPDHCTRGPIEQAFCTTCGEIVYQKIIR